MRNSKVSRASKVARRTEQPRETCPRCQRRVPGSERLSARGPSFVRRLSSTGLYGRRLAAMVRGMAETPVSDVGLSAEQQDDLDRLRTAGAVERASSGWIPVRACAQCGDKILKALVPYECPLCGHLADPRAAKKQRLANLKQAASKYSLARRFLSRYPETQAWGARRSRWLLPAWSPGIADLQRASGADGATVAATVRELEALRLIHEARGLAFRLNPDPCESCLSTALAPVETMTTATREPIPAQLRFRVLQRDGFRCRYCGRGAAQGAVLQLDHVVPVVAGGETSEDNLITACIDCNLGKSATDVIQQ